MSHSAVRTRASVDATSSGGLRVYPKAWSEHFVGDSILLVLVTRRGGALSLDHLIARRT